MNDLHILRYVNNEFGFFQNGHLLYDARKNKIPSYLPYIGHRNVFLKGFQIKNKLPTELY